MLSRSLSLDKKSSIFAVFHSEIEPYVMAVYRHGLETAENHEKRQQLSTAFNNQRLPQIARKRFESCGH
jgi:hypothetical protein